ncbi:MAG: aminotransferase class V-fold PLP-dependent enzyme [Solirubrobacteraceae bacterium]
MDLSGLRAEFPVLSGVAYLNAGTDGPLPHGAVHAAAEELRREAQEGRSSRHFERRGELNRSLRTAYASVLGCAAEDIALTTCTSEGLSLVLGGLGLAPGEEILTSDEEHPGLLGALAAERELRGVAIRTAPWSQLPAAVGPRTRLVACSHVSWMTGCLAPTAELAATGVPLLLDGAQGVGAVPTDVRALGCAAYAGAGQKWLCGPDGTGMLYVAPELRERLAVARRGYANLADPNSGLDARLCEDARRLDTLSLNAETVACAVAAFTVLERFGWARLHERARLLAAELAERLAARGREVIGRAMGPGHAVRGTGSGAAGSRGAGTSGVGGSSVNRDDTTLVTFSSPDPLVERERLSELGVVLRDIPGRPWLRASVGAWNDEGDLARLVDALRE